MKIKFNLGWILAIAAAIVLAAMGFMSFYYRTGGSLVLPIIVAVCLLVLPIVVSMYMVPAKECSKPFYFHQEAVKEISLLCAMIVLFVASMFLVNHFFTVNSRTKQISAMVAEQRRQYDDMFADYQKYCDKRVDIYGMYLEQIHADDISQYKEALRGYISVSKENSEDIYGSEQKKWWNLPKEMKNVEKVSTVLEEAYQTITERDHNPAALELYPRQDNEFWEYPYTKAGDIMSLFTETDGLITSIWAVLSVLIIYLLIMLPYISAERDLRSKGLFAELGKRDDEGGDDESNDNIGKL